MSTKIFRQFNGEDGAVINISKADEPVSASEILVREEIRRLSDNAAEIKRLGDQVEVQAVEAQAVEAPAKE